MSDEKTPFPGEHLGDNYYLVTEDELKDAVIFRPGLPESDFDQTTELPHRRVTRGCEFSLMDVVIFFDWSSNNEVDLITQCNQWAFVVDETQALYFNRKVHSVPLNKLHELDQATVIKRFPEPVAKLIAPVLKQYRGNPMMFEVAVNHLMCNNLLPVITQTFFPPDIHYNSEAEYEEQWSYLIDQLEPRDAIFTFDRSSLLSRTIARFTHGPFSHCGVYAGEGVLGEIVTSGSRMVSLDVYKGRRYRVAAYRHYGRAPDTVEEMVAKMKAEVGQISYSYLGAFWAGVKAFYGHHLDAYTPNSIILSGYLTFIAQA